MSDISDLFGLVVVGGIVWFTLPYVTGGAIGGGGSASGHFIYRTTGKTCRGSSGSQTIGCGGGNSPSKRVDFNNCNLRNYAVIAKIKFGGGCGCGDEATIKHLGPGHSDGNCCWAISTVMQNGSTCFGGEGPHPETEKCQQKLGNLGNLSGRTIVMQSIVWAISNGYHQELWVDKTGIGNRWSKMGSRNMSTWGNDKKTNRISSNQQIECRIDCSGAQWISYEAAEIVVPLAGRYARAVDPPPVIEYVPTIPKMAEIEQQLAYNTQVKMPQIMKPIVVESYLTKRRRKLAGY